MMGKSQWRLTFDSNLIADSPLETVMRFLERNSTSKRSLVEKALVNFYLPEAVIHSSQPLTSQQSWELRLAISELEARLKLYREFFSDTTTTLNKLNTTLPRLENAARAVASVVDNIHELEPDDDELANELPDDDDFADGGI